MPATFCRLLLADDSAVVRAALGRRLRAAGIDVVEADSLASALAIEPDRIDFALLDFDLGDGYGDAVAARLRAAKPDLPLAFFTSELGERLASYGKVFAKPDETEAAIAWVLAVSRS